MTAQAESYCLHRANGMDGRNAAIQAGYSAKAADTAVHRLNKDNRVKARIAELREKIAVRTKLDVDDVVEQAARIAMLDVRDFLTETGALKEMQNWPDSCAKSIQGFEVTSNGEDQKVTKIKLADRNSALDKLFRHLGLYEKDNSQKNSLENVSTNKLIETLQRQYQQLEQILPVEVEQ